MGHPLASWHDRPLHEHPLLGWCYDSPLDISGALLPVTAVGDDEIIFAEQILPKCMQIDTVDHQYVATFSCSWLLKISTYFFLQYTTYLCMS